MNTNYFKNYFLYILLNIYHVYTQVKMFGLNVIKGVLWNTITKVTVYSMDDSSNIEVVYDITNPYHFMFGTPYNIVKKGFVFDVEKGFCKSHLNKDIVFFSHSNLMEEDIIYATVDDDHNDLSPFINKYMKSLANLYTHEVFHIMYMMGVIPECIKNKIDDGFVEINIMTDKSEYVKLLKARDYFNV